MWSFVWREALGVRIRGGPGRPAREGVLRGQWQRPTDLVPCCRSRSGLEPVSGADLFRRTTSSSNRIGTRRRKNATAASSIDRSFRTMHKAQAGTRGPTYQLLLRLLSPASSSRRTCSGTSRHPFRVLAPLVAHRHRLPSSRRGRRWPFDKTNTRHTCRLRRPGRTRRVAQSAGPFS